jgi:hypothetical protein
VRRSSGGSSGHALVVSIVGLAFIAAALLSLVRLRQVRWATVRDGTFLVGLAVTLGFQLGDALNVLARPGDSGSVQTIASLVVVWQPEGGAGPAAGTREGQGTPPA